MMMLLFCIRNYLTIIPRARMGYNAIAHEAEAARKESRVRYPGAIFVLNLPDGQVFVFGKFKLQKDCN